MILTMSSGKGFADIEVKKVSCRNILASYILRFEFEFTIFAQKAPFPRMTDYEVELLVHSGSSLIEIGRLLKVSPQEIVQSYHDGRKTSCYLEIELSREKLDALEELRYKGDLRFELKLIGMIYHENEINNINANTSYTIPQSEWVKLLSKINYSHIDLIEMPGIHPQKSSLENKIYENLKKANQLALEGRFAQCVAQCRFVLENISSFLGDEKGMRDIRFKGKEHSKEERKQLIRKAVFNLSHLAHHDDNKVTVQWTRSDALALIKYCCAIIQHNLLNN